MTRLKTVMFTQNGRFIFWFCVTVWTSTAQARETQSRSFTKHSNSVMTAPDSVVTCENKDFCSKLRCAIMCMSDSACKSFSAKITGSGKCIHHRVKSSDVSATVAADVEWVTFEKGDFLSLISLSLFLSPFPPPFLFHSHSAISFGEN